MKNLSISALKIVPNIVLLLFAQAILANKILLPAPRDSIRPFQSIQVSLLPGAGIVLGESSGGLGQVLKATRPSMNLVMTFPLSGQVGLRAQGNFMVLKNNVSDIQSRSTIGGGGIAVEGGFFLLTRQPKRAMVYGLAGFFLNKGKVNRDIDTIKTTNLSFWSIPVGAGIRLRLGNSWHLGTEVTYFICNTDDLDGVSRGRGKDSYAQLTLGVYKRFDFTSKKKSKNTSVAHKDGFSPVVKRDTIPDRDNDGVLDSLDQCPDAKGYIFSKGCPDMDQDSIPDKQDLCKELAGSRLTKGCPDPDGDGLVGKEELCPKIKGVVGDNDNDGIKDGLEKDSCVCNPNPNCSCRETCAGSCDPAKDSDGDGVLNEEDKCPCKEGKKCPDGCPPPDPDADQDGDGMKNITDKCPCEKGESCNEGCPLPPDEDADKDGVKNSKDKHPCEKGPVCNNGSPNNGDEDCDGLTGKDEKCPGRAGKKIGSKLDSDGDGVPDTEDLCDCEPAKSTCHCGCPSGCDPNADTDGDKVRNASDVNPCVKDLDNDGVPDSEDDCIALPGSVKNKGCPDKK